MIEIGKKYYLLVLKYEEIQTNAKWDFNRAYWDPLMRDVEDIENYKNEEYGLFLKSAKIVERKAKIYAFYSPHTWHRQQKKNRMVHFGLPNDMTNILANDGNIITWERPQLSRGRVKPSIILFFNKEKAVNKLLSLKGELMETHWAKEKVIEAQFEKRKYIIEYNHKRLLERINNDKIKRMEKTSETMKMISKLDKELKAA
jgi:hypothetical protein